MYQRIKDLREDKGYTQTSLAAELHCSQTCYSKYELGQRDIPTEILLRMAGLYGVNVDYILGLTNEKKPYPRIKP